MTGDLQMMNQQDQLVFCKGHASIRAVSLHVFTKGMSADMRTYDASEDIRQNRLTDRPEGN